MAPKLKESGSRAFVLCQKSDIERTLLGRLVAKDNGAGYDWDGIDLHIDCEA